MIDGRYHFSLVDTNSMKCGSGVSIEAGCRNLAKLSGDDALFAQLAECYAMERKADPVRCRHADKWGKGEIEKAAWGGVTGLTQNKALYPFINPLAEFPVNRLTSWQVYK